MSDGNDDIFGGRTREQVLADAAAYGVDLGLIAYNRSLSVEQRLATLDDNVAWIAEIRRNRARRLAGRRGTA